jgi:hypothetical protein
MDRLYPKTLMQPDDAPKINTLPARRGRAIVAGNVVQRVRRCPVLNNTEAVTRFRMPAFDATRTPAVGSLLMAHMAAVSAYTPSIDARNDAQGGADAWRPPV